MSLIQTVSAPAPAAPAAPEAPPVERIELRFLAHDRPLHDRGEGGRVCRVAATRELLVVIDFVRPGEAHIEAQLIGPAGRFGVLTRRAARPLCIHDGDWRHLDLFVGGKTIVSLTIDGRHRLIYARTSLLEDAALAPGSYDRPVVLRR
jgi:hypothetical protein